jgi:hypothetical protein
MRGKNMKFTKQTHLFRTNKPNYLDHDPFPNGIPPLFPLKATETTQTTTHFRMATAITRRRLVCRDQAEQ